MIFETNMRWMKPWLKWAEYEDVREEAIKRGIIAPPFVPVKTYNTMTCDEFLALTPSTYINPNNNVQYSVRKSYWDENYNLTTVDEIKRYLKWSLVDKAEYIADQRDCNTFAVTLWGCARMDNPGLALGLILIPVPAHAKNFFFDERKILWAIEPQSDVVTPIDKTASHFFL